jgi:hypothetical protein
VPETDITSPGRSHQADPGSPLPQVAPEGVAPEGLATHWPWLLAIAVGTLLRGFRLLDQAPVDDEWHAIHRVLGMDYGEIATSFGLVDHCIPLTLYLKLAADTIGVGDVVFRLPSFVAGVASLVVLPGLVRRHVDRRSLHLFAWLVAISPLLILYARTARPYAIAVIFSILALAALERWWQEDARPRALAYGVWAALACWFLPVVAPFVAAPLLVLAAATMRSEGGGTRALARRLAPPVLAFGFFAALLLLPPLLSHPEAVTAKLGGARPDLASVGRSARFFVGATSPWVAGLFAVLAAVGAFGLARQAPRFAALALAASALQLAALAAAAPDYAWLGIVNARYLLPALPVFLLCVAIGTSRSALGRSSPALAGVAICALLLANSHLATTLVDTSRWLPNRWIAEMEGTPARPANVSAFYRELATRPPGTVRLVESPWYYSLWNNLLPYYEPVHRQQVRVGFTTGLCSSGEWGEYPPDEGFDLSSFVHLSDVATLTDAEQGADYVVFHRDLAAEMAEIIDPIDVRATRQPDTRACIEAIRARGWPEVYQDGSIRVFEVRRTE